MLPLANFGTVAFTSASATINGTTGPISDSAWSAIAIDMASNRGAAEATTSVLSSTGDGFSVSYDSSGGSSGIGGFGFGGLNFSTNASSTSQGQASSQLAARDQLFASEFDFFHV